ncbi:hypothetical protein B0T26DRAFT_810120 [Lasiosphaeria miniovina]|uniref:Uncharacterized protein n=1 Tax=Lasiosphaeria miniovina TaxID=1954250 RepID=A0AA40E7I4_9PEZI|nr:uncharacterized protein B0T26DRAFT_810120 [Lasiosphaeria miniovina]KAK0727942.1 hypothetical protein B0T26DRAFT_810120 [Lasiosphaeria miniovina]
MSLVDRSLPFRRVYSSPPTFGEPIFDDFCDMDDHESMAPSPKRARPSDEAPALPQKSALRASRLVDNLGLKLGGSLEAIESGQATPLDVYLSSEEDASSDADDFSDYDYDSSNDDPSSPTRRSSHEVTARVVSVVFSGKPLIVDLTELRRRSISPNSVGTRTRSSTVSSNAPTLDRSVTPESSVSSPVQQTPERENSISDAVARKKPLFLNIDPFANGSTYSLELSNKTAHSNGLEQDNTSSPVRPPRTPTQLFKGVTRTFSLVRKRSRPTLNTSSNLSQAPRDPFSSTSSPRSSLNTGPAAAAAAAAAEPEAAAAEQQPTTPQTPVTYNDILRAVKKNAIMMPGVSSAQQQEQMISPVSPSQAPKRGILSGLASRRRSIKMTGKLL